MHDAQATRRASRRPRFAPSKFVAPTQAEWHVRRDGLRHRLDAAGDRLRVVVGPPGTGKTALLAEWCQADVAARTCWLHADEADRDPVRFWYAVIAAVQPKAPTFGVESSELLQVSPEIDHEWLESLLTTAGELTEPTTVIVDDFHRVGTEVQQQVRFLLDRGTEPLRFVFATRVEPDLGLHRLRLADRLCELREADLRFDRDTARAVCEYFGARLGDEPLDTIMERTAGWPAAVQLSALALRDSHEPDAVIDGLTGTTQVIFHYLFAEVFAAQRPDFQRMLLDVCVVDELEPGLVEALSPNNPVSLADIERAGLLLRRIDDGDGSFRLHHLLIDMLRFRLRSSDPTHEAVLHERAARWYVEQHRPADGFHHQWRAGDRPGALRTLHGTELDVRYDSLVDVSAAERSLTDDDVRSFPPAAVSYAGALLINGLLADAQRLAKRVGVLSRGQMTADEQDELDAVLICTAFALGDTDATVQAAAAARGRDDRPSTPWAVIARCVLARAHTWQLEYDIAEQQLRGALPADATELQRMEFDGDLAQLQLFRGDLADCERTLHGLFETLDGGGRDDLRDGTLAESVRAGLELDRGDLSAAEQRWRAVTEARSNLRTAATVLANVGLSRIFAFDGRIDAAMVAVDRAYRTVPTRPPRSGVVDYIRRQHARTLLSAGDLDGAQAVTDTIEIDARSRLLLSAEIALADDRIGDAERALAGLEAWTHQTTRTRVEVALARVGLGAVADGDVIDDVSLILDIVERERLVFPLAESTSRVLAAVQDGARRRARSTTIDEVLRLRGRLPPPDAIAADRVDLLSERERAVLRYLATSLTYTEIASEMYVSINTIKTHVKNINLKLRTTSRRAALDRARALHYL